MWKPAWYFWMRFLLNGRYMVEILGWTFFVISMWLMVYGANALLLTLIFLFRRLTRTDGDPPSSAAVRSWPEVTIQLPVYNEPTVVRRLIDSAARMDYPAEKLTIQVLDDSTDDTTRLALEQVDYWKSRGRKISLIHRLVRTEYKAGALKNGMEKERSEFQAVFDADFVPAAGWLKRALQPFLQAGGESIGMVQTRWSHLNEAQSPLTRAQALLLDGHFGIEQRVRSTEGLFFGFNGTAGIWRRRCIEDGGGWRGDTLSEDLDLSYRAQLKGWKFVYLPRVTAPAELPTTMSAFKIQQFRWAKGAMQAVRMDVPRILQAPIGLWRKVQGVLHISGFFVHPLIVLMVLLSLPLAFAGPQALHDVPMAWLSIGALGAPAIFTAAEWSLYPKQGWWKRTLWLPVLIMLGTGVAVSNSKAVISGLLNIRSPFQRTPKQGVPDAKNRRPANPQERVRVDLITWLEIALAAYSLCTAVVDIHFGYWINAVYLLIYAAGFAWVGLATVLEAFSPWLPKPSPSKMVNARMD
jgi:cellulose synthase/poly-beta-1,6-N-acetylglucosamine synthase-like glycosyltransferase